MLTIQDYQPKSEDMNQSANALQQEVQDLTRINKTLQQEIEVLKKEMRASEEGEQELNELRKQRDDAIANSIAARLQLGKEHDVASPSKESVTGAALAPPTKLRMTTTKVMKLDVIPAGAKTPTNNIAYDQPFNVAIGVDTKALGLEQEAAIGCTAQLHAKPIEGGSALYVGQYTGTISKEGTLTVQASARTLPHGFYYLQAKLTVRERKAGEQPLNVVEEHDAINVY